MLKLFATLRHLTLPAFFSLLLLAAGCNQDPIFDYISGETAPTEAKIKGSPSKIVNIGEKLYLANGRLWEYAPAAANSSWSRMSGPAGFAADVASTSDGALYVLVMDNAATGVWQRKDDGAGWTELGLPEGYGFAQNIFGAGDLLFVTVAKGISDDDYRLCYKDEAGSLSILADINGALLVGAGKIDNYYYLAAQGKGIYKVSVAGAAATAELIATPAIPTNVAGLFQANLGLIIGISKDGVLLQIDTLGLKVHPTSLGGAYSGAIAVMQIPEPQEGFDLLLLLGNQNESLYAHGYTEILLNSQDKTFAASSQSPGQSLPSSISDSSDSKRQYESSLKRYPVTALWVLPKSGEDPHSVIFAATSNQGLYSYRSRSGGWQWNHEE